MRKHLILISTAIFATACSQTPAPFDVYGTRYYGKNVRTDVRKNSTTSAPLTDDYNNKIDSENSSRIMSRPLGSTREDPNYVAPVSSNRNGEVYSHQLSDGSTIKSRQLAPVAIDSDQQVVRVNNNSRLGATGTTVGSIHSGGSTQMASNNPFRSPVIQQEETVPPIEKKENFVNPSEVNAERKSSNSLAKIRPMPKPKYQGEEQAEDVQIAPVEKAAVEKTVINPPAQHEKPKIAAKIQKVETSAGSIDKSTPKMLNQNQLLKKPLAEPEETANDVADEEDEVVKPKSTPAPAVTAKVAPVKATALKAPVKAASDGTAADADDDVPEVAVSQTTTPDPEPAEEPAPKVAAVKPAPASTKSSAQFIKPVDGVVVSEFGNDKNGSFNDGINIQAPEGTPVKAASGGTVVYSGNQLQGYGNMIIIKHPNGYLSAYSHLKELELKKGESIDQGKVVGHVGKTGNVDTPQLHFGIRKGREPVDPKGYLSSNQ